VGRASQEKEKVVNLELAKPRKLLMPRDRIELSTHGFSGACIYRIRDNRKKE